MNSSSSDENSDVRRERERVREEMALRSRKRKRGRNRKPDPAPIEYDSSSDDEKTEEERREKWRKYKKMIREMDMTTQEPAGQTISRGATSSTEVGSQHGSAEESSGLKNGNSSCHAGMSTFASHVPTGLQNSSKALAEIMDTPPNSVQDGESMEEDYNPTLSEADNPFYYKQNKTLHMLYLERRKRHGMKSSQDLNH